jgi:uncharacterized protein YodC (DUF2158 family)
MEVDVLVAWYDRKSPASEVLQENELADRGFPTTRWP